MAYFDPIEKGLPPARVVTLGDMITVYGLNVHGFSKARRDAQEELFKSFSEERPDFICLQETKCLSHPLLELLHQDLGFVESTYAKAGVAIASTHPIRKCDPQEFKTNRSAFEDRFLEVEIGGLRVVSAYAYSIQKSEKKEEREVFYQWLAEYMRDNASRRVVIATDLNLCLGKMDADNDEQRKSGWFDEECQEPMLGALNKGWVDVWRKVHGLEKRRDTVWFNNGRKCNFGTPAGYGIDYQFVSPLLATSIQDASIIKPRCPTQERDEPYIAFDSRVREARRTGFSDHALTKGHYRISLDSASDRSAP